LSAVSVLDLADSFEVDWWLMQGKEELAFMKTVADSPVAAKFFTGRFLYIGLPVDTSIRYDATKGLLIALEAYTRHTDCQPPTQVFCFPGGSHHVHVGRVHERVVSFSVCEYAYAPSVSCFHANEVNAGTGR
jgi:hypothetical protein